MIELVVVVVIIGLLAALATPAITGQMRDRRANQASQEIANFYRGARMRALGRGSSVLVRYQKGAGAPAGSLEVWEAVAGEDGACGPIPRKGCQAFPPPGDDPPATQQLINQFNPGIRGEYEGVDIAMQPIPSTEDSEDAAEDASGGELPYVDVCFTPMGATFLRTSASAQSMLRMTGVMVAQVTREGAAGRRDVLILPSGAARVKGKIVEEAVASEAEGDSE